MISNNKLPKRKHNPARSRKTTSQVGFKNTKAILKALEDGKSVKPLIKNQELCPLIKVGHTVNEGSFGVISTLKKPKFTIPVVVKTLKKKKPDIGPGSEIYVETVIGSLLAEEYNRGEALGFTRLFSSFMCKGRAHTISERLDGSIDEFPSIVGRKLVDDDVHNILFQLMAALYFAQTKYRFMHRDLHPGNFLLQKITSDLRFQRKKLSKVKFFTYNIEGTLYKIPNRGYLVKIIDLGTSSVLTTIDKKPKLVAQDIVLKRKWNGLFGHNWGNFGPDFEPSLDPIFAFSSLLRDNPISAFLPKFRKNKLFRRILGDMFSPSSGYLNSGQVLEAGRKNNFPFSWWTLTKHIDVYGSESLRRPFGALPNNLFSPEKIIENYFGFYKEDEGSSKRSKRHISVSM